MEEKNKYNQCLLLNGYEFLDFENTKNTTLKEWLKDENFLLFIKSIPKDYIFIIKKYSIANGIFLTHKKTFEQAEQGKVKSYVQDIALAVLDCKETATSRETFIRLMNERGYGVDWQDSHKYITYTDLAREQAGEKACKIRDNKLEKYYNMDFGKESMEHEFERNARTAEAEQSKRAASRVKPTEPDRAGKQSAQRSVGDVERELRGIDEAVKSRTIQPNEKFIFKCPNCSRKNRKVFYAF